MHDPEFWKNQFLCQKEITQGFKECINEYKDLISEYKNLLTSTSTCKIKDERPDFLKNLDTPLSTAKFNENTTAKIQQEKRLNVFGN